MPPPRAQGLEHADFARPFGDGHQHDVHHAHRADAQGERADDEQQHLEADPHARDQHPEFIPVQDGHRPLIAFAKMVCPGQRRAQAGDELVP
jgi:hypothetical protein